MLNLYSCTSVFVTKQGNIKYSFKHMQNGILT